MQGQTEVGKGKGTRSSIPVAHGAHVAPQLQPRQDVVCSCTQGHGRQHPSPIVAGATGLLLMLLHMVAVLLLLLQVLAVLLLQVLAVLLHAVLWRLQSRHGAARCRACAVHEPALLLQHSQLSCAEAVGCKLLLLLLLPLLQLQLLLQLLARNGKGPQLLLQCCPCRGSLCIHLLLLRVRQLLLRLWLLLLRASMLLLLLQHLQHRAALRHCLRHQRPFVGQLLLPSCGCSSGRRPKSNLGQLLGRLLVGGGDPPSLPMRSRGPTQQMGSVRVVRVLLAGRAVATNTASHAAGMRTACADAAAAHTAVAAGADGRGGAARAVVRAVVAGVVAACGCAGA